MDFLQKETGKEGSTERDGERSVLQRRKVSQLGISAAGAWRDK